MKRIIPWIGVFLVSGALVVLAVLLFSTCVLGNHRYAPATCTEPERCVRCGKTRGEALGHDFRTATCTEPAVCSRCGYQSEAALGHDFLPATCTAPETCARCGATNGEPLGHVMTEATYQNAAQCTRCGYVDGEPRTPAMRDLACTWMEVGVPYPYTTASYEDYDLDVTGTAAILDYHILDGDDTLPAREGYEWHVVTVQLVFSGEDAQKNGMQSAMTFGDYYKADAEVSSPADENGFRTFVINYYGTRVQCWQKTLPAEEADWYGKELRFTWKEAVLVPRGYDGTVLVLYHYRLAMDAERLFVSAKRVLNKDALVFRMDGTGAAE